MTRLIVMAGLPASGKSSIARELSRRLGAVWLRIDSIDQAIWESVTAPRDLQDWTYRAAQAVAADNLSIGHDVIADCVNDCREARHGWAESGRGAGADVFWLEIICSDPVEHRRRVETRVSDIAGLTLPDWSAILDRGYHQWDHDRCTIDTSCHSVEESVASAMAALAETSR